MYTHVRNSEERSICHKDPCVQCVYILQNQASNEDATIMCIIDDQLCIIKVNVIRMKRTEFVFLTMIYFSVVFYIKLESHAM